MRGLSRIQLAYLSNQEENDYLGEWVGLVGYHGTTCCFFTWSLRLKGGKIPPLFFKHVVLADSQVS